MNKFRAFLLFIGLTLGVYADSWLIGGQPVNSFELWAGNDLSLDPETGELIVTHGIDLSDYPDARILLDHDATNDNEVVNYRTATNLIALLQPGGGDNLGNHTATENLNLGYTNALTGVKEISFWDSANGLATVSVYENWFRFAGGGFGIQASELKADDFLTAGGGDTLITLGDDETTIKGADLLLLESQYQSILRSVSNGDTLIESGSPSDNEYGEIFITSKHDDDAIGGEIFIRAQHPPEEGSRGHIMFEGDVTFSNGSLSVGSIIIQDGSSDISGVNEVFAGAVNIGNQQLAESDAGLTVFDLNDSVARQVLSGFAGVSAESDFVREVVFPLVDDIRPAFTNSPVVILSLATPVSEWVMVNLLFVSETNFTYEIMTSGGPMDDSWPVNWAAFARTP